MFEVIFPRQAVDEFGGCRVFIRRQWDYDWEEAPHLHCLAARWCAAPEMPEATLRWVYGVGMREGEIEFAVVEPLTSLNRCYVKIEIQPNATEGDGTNQEPLVWYGVIDNESRDLGGSDLFENGEQVFTAYGLEMLLERHWVYSAVWRSDQEIGEAKTERGLPFNIDGEGEAASNRSENKGLDSYLFAGNSDSGFWWSTYEIVEYLLAHETPRNQTDERAIRFKLRDDDHALPRWDHPRLESHGKTTRGLLNQLLARERLLSYTIEVEGQDIVLRPFTFAGADIALDAGEGVAGAEIRANAQQVLIGLDFDRTARANLSLDTVAACDQVRVMGARRRSVCTLSFADETLETGWLPDREAEYEAGASGDPDYPTPSKREQRQIRNAEARSAERLRLVYSRFAVPDAWDLFAGDGLGGLAMFPVFPDDVDEAESFPVYPGQLALLTSLPLLSCLDYSGSRIADGTVLTIDRGPQEERRPLAIFKIPGTERYQRIERFGDIGKIEFSGRRIALDFSGEVQVVPGDRAVHVRIHGAPQHVIASADFTKLDGVDDNLHIVNFRDAVFTVAFADDRFCEATYPPDRPARDEVRVMVIEAGDRFLADWCVPGTVVDVDRETGELVRSDSGGWINDDQPQLASLAKLAFEWYGVTRRRLKFSTRTVTNALHIGDYVTRVNKERNIVDVGTVITGLAITIPVSESPTPEPPQLVVETDFAAFDPLATLPS